MSLARTERACTLHSHKHVTGSVNRSDQRPPIIGLIFELRPQTVDINIQGILLYIGCDPPTRFDQLFASSNQTRTPNESFEQFKLLPREGNLLAKTDSHAAVSIECDTSRARWRQLDRRNASRDGPDTRQENLQNKWIDEVIVRTQIEGLQYLRDRIHSRQNEYWRFAAFGAHLFKNFESIHLREKNVHQRGVKLPGEENVRPLSTVMRDGDTMPIFSQRTFDQTGDSLVIFDDQYVHLWRTTAYLMTLRS